MSIATLLMVCAFALLALGAVVTLIVAGQIRTFARHLREEENENQETGENTANDHDNFPESEH